MGLLMLFVAAFLIVCLVIAFVNAMATTARKHGPPPTVYPRPQYRPGPPPLYQAPYDHRRGP